MKTKPDYENWWNGLLFLAGIGVVAILGVMAVAAYLLLF